MRIWKLSVMAGLWASLVGFSQQAWCAQGEPIDIGDVRPHDVKTVYSIAIPAFRPVQGSKRLREGTFNSIIYNDLALSGHFKPAEDQRQVEQAAARDRSAASVDYGQWGAQGADFVVVCDYNYSESEELTATCRLFSVADRGRIFGRSYPGQGTFKASEHRRLAHWISDEILKMITQFDGVARTKIVFIGRVGQNKEVFVMDADGENLGPLTRDSSLNATPSWGQNATEIYYTSYKDFNPDLCGVYLTGGKSWFISQRNGFNLSPDYNVESKKITLTLGQDGNQEIYTMDRNGRDLKRLTYNKAIDCSPAWSPSGNQLAFTSDRKGSPQIYLMENDGTNQRRASMRHHYNDSADWSPNGDRIAFASKSRPGDKFNIWTMDASGGDWVQLTHGEGDSEHPSWAPNGDQIVFASDRTGTFQVYVMNADGSNVTKLTSKGENYTPSWSPHMP